MSLKENIKVIKEELSAEEKFLESVIKTESFYKKNKKYILGFVVAVLVGIFASMGYNYIKEQKLKEANQLYKALLKTPDKTKLEKLKDLNPKLFELYSVHMALKKSDIKKLTYLVSNIKDPILKDIVSYQIASLQKSGLQKYFSKSDAVFKDFATIQAAYIELEKKNYKKADDILSFISPSSSFYQIAQGLRHFIMK